HTVLEHVDGRVGEAGIVVAADLPLEQLLGVPRIRVGVARGKVERLRGLAMRAARAAAMHQLRCGRQPGRVAQRVLRLRHRAPETKNRHAELRPVSMVPLAICFKWLQSDRPNHHCPRYKTDSSLASIAAIAIGWRTMRGGGAAMADTDLWPDGVFP